MQVSDHTYGMISALKTALLSAGVEAKLADQAAARCAFVYLRKPHFAGNTKQPTPASLLIGGYRNGQYYNTHLSSQHPTSSTLLVAARRWVVEYDISEFSD